MVKRGGVKRAASRRYLTLIARFDVADVESCSERESGPLRAFVSVLAQLANQAIADTPEGTARFLSESAPGYMDRSSLTRR